MSTKNEREGLGKQLNKLLMKTIKIIILLLLPFFCVTAQNNSPLTSKTYKLIDIELVGDYNIDKNSVLKLMDLSLNQDISIPGDQITNGLKTLWNQKLFSDIQISKIHKTENDIILQKIHSCLLYTSPSPRD